MVNTQTMEKLLSMDDSGYIDFSYMTGNYEAAFQREKLYEVLYKRCFDDKKDNYSLVAKPGTMEIDGYSVPDEDLFGEYIDRYVCYDVDCLYTEVIERLSKYGNLYKLALFNDEVIELASLDDSTFSGCEKQIRSMDHVKTIFPEKADIDGFKKAFPDLNSELADWLCYDPLNENGTLVIFAYESEEIGKLFTFETDDVRLLSFREQLTSHFIGFTSNMVDGKFYMYLIFGNMEDQMATIEDMPSNFIGMVALLEQMIDMYTKEEETCKAA